MLSFWPTVHHRRKQLFTSWQQGSKMGGREASPKPFKGIHWWPNFLSLVPKSQGIYHNTTQPCNEVFLHMYFWEYSKFKLQSLYIYYHVIANILLYYHYGTYLVSQLHLIVKEKGNYYSQYYFQYITELLLQVLIITLKEIVMNERIENLIFICRKR